MWYLWSQWWTQKAITEPGISLTFSNYVYYPEGNTLLYNDYSPYNRALAFLLWPIFNPVVIYNLLILHTFILSGIGAFLLIRYLSGNLYASLIGGFIFAFNPAHFAHSLHHAGFASIQFIPFFILFYIKSLRGEGKANLWLACLFFLLNTLCSWVHLVLALYFMGFSYIYLMTRRKRFLMPGVLFKTGVVITSTLLVLSPWLIKMILLGWQHPEVTKGGHNTYVADALAFFVPHSYHCLANLEIVK